MRTLVKCDAKWPQRNLRGHRPLVIGALKDGGPYRNLYQTASNPYMPEDADSYLFLTKMQKMTSKKGEDRRFRPSPPFFDARHDEQQMVMDALGSHPLHDGDVFRVTFLRKRHA